MSKKNIYKITFILAPFILAFAFHFLYEYISFPLFAIYSPVNESVFEHIKLTFTPFILNFLILNNKHNLNIVAKFDMLNYT